MPRSASVVAFKKTVALALNETVLRPNNPKLCLKLYRNLATHHAWGEKNGLEPNGFGAGEDS